MTKEELLEKLHAAKARDGMSSDLFNDLIRYFNAPIGTAKTGDSFAIAWDLIIHVVTVSKVGVTND